MKVESVAFAITGELPEMPTNLVEQTMEETRKRFNDAMDQMILAKNEAQHGMSTFFELKKQLDLVDQYLKETRNVRFPPMGQRQPRN